MTIGLGHYLAVGAILFTLGILGIFLNRKNVIIILMSIELILLAVNINLVAFSAFLGDIVGQVYALIVLTVAAAEAAIGLSILVVFYRNRGSIAAAIALVGARMRYPGGSPPAGAENHAYDRVPHHAAPAVAGGGVIHPSHHEAESQEPAALGSRSAELITTGLLFVSALLS